jgi:hypothetical protein
MGNEDGGDDVMGNRDESNKAVARQARGKGRVRIEK